MKERLRSKLSPVFILALGATAMSGCLAPGADVGVTSSTVTTPETNAPIENASIDADLYFKLERKWEDQDEYEEETLVCTVPKDSAATDSTCSVTIPEARMFFSDFRFTWGSTNSSVCKVMIFRPYYFLGSNTSAAFVPYWSTDQSSPLDCTVSPTPADCYMGSARYVVPSFPSNTSLYVLSAQQQEGSEEINSAIQNGLISNRLMSNNYATPAAAIANEYVANSMQPYQVECRDEWYTLRHRITITISDEDEDGGEDPGGPEDHFSDWN